MMVWKRWLLLIMAIFGIGIYVKCLGCNHIGLLIGFNGMTLVSRRWLTWHWKVSRQCQYPGLSLRGGLVWQGAIDGSEWRCWTMLNMGNRKPGWTEFCSILVSRVCHFPPQEEGTAILTFSITWVAWTDCRPPWAMLLGKVDWFPSFFLLAKLKTKWRWVHTLDSRKWCQRMVMSVFELMMMMMMMMMMILIPLRKRLLMLILIQTDVGRVEVERFSLYSGKLERPKR